MILHCRSGRLQARPGAGLSGFINVFFVVIFCLGECAFVASVDLIGLISLCSIDLVTERTLPKEVHWYLTALSLVAAGAGRGCWLA